MDCSKKRAGYGYAYLSLEGTEFQYTMPPQFREFGSKAVSSLIPWSDQRMYPYFFSCFDSNWDTMTSGPFEYI